VSLQAQELRNRSSHVILDTLAVVPRMDQKYGKVCRSIDQIDIIITTATTTTLHLRLAVFFFLTFTARVLITMVKMIRRRRRRIG
jgi:hypothetical protein